LNAIPKSSAGELKDLQVLWTDSERALCRGRRLDPRGGSTPVLAVISVAEHPPLAFIDRLAREYALKDELEPAFAACPLELLRDGSRTLLLLNDPGAEPLERLIGPPMETETFLRIAIGITRALAKAHARGLVHKDVKPANILVNCADGGARLTGFGIASHLSEEGQAPNAAETISGALAYMAPEQTGRVSRPIDFRSDLYGLGVTFYQMLTGALPFNCADPLEWIHCHIARKPTPPAERLMTVPAVLSDIVMKLLAKTADERYQGAAGLEHDLTRCLSQWRAQGFIEPVSLGERDTPDRLVIPAKLYGREREVDGLRSAFERVAAGRGPELVLIVGPAGAGKSSVANELRRAVAPELGQFASGKFDPLKRDIPYASLAHALMDLLRPLLAMGDAELAPWREALRRTLGVNGALMATLLTELELLIGPQPAPRELPPRDAQRRFHLVCGRLLSVFARPERPLALFLDDLQWLDAATIDLIEDLLTEPDLHHLLLIGAYRDDEVASSHPLRGRLAAIREAGARVDEIVLKPLALANVRQIVADALRSDRIRPLAALVHQKTAGNPFFVNQFLRALAEEGLLAFDRDAAHWTWDLRGIRAKGYTDNVVDLMLSKLRSLPAATRALLKRLACLGYSSPIATLAIVEGKSEETLHATLKAAVQAGLLWRQEGAYKFLHDRVREAAYALIPRGRRAAAHLVIGRRLAAGARRGAIEANVFEIAGQLNRGAALISSGEERDRLAELNLIAARRAKSATAYASALTYLAAGASMLPGDAWRRRHDLAFALELNRAECEFLTGALREAEARLVELADRAASPPELATLTRLRVDLFMTLGRSDRAVEVGVDCLRRLGVDLSARPSDGEVKEEYAWLWRRLGDRPIANLVDLPPMKDSVACAATDVLTSLVTPALYSDENLRCVIIGRMANLNLEHGNSDAACYAYTAAGNVLGLSFGDYESGFRFCQLGLDLAEQPGMERLRARVYLAFGNLAKPSPRHSRTGRTLARHAFETAQQAGDLTYAAISCNNLLTQLLACGASLAEAMREAETGLDFSRRARFSVVSALITAQLRLIKTLSGLTPNFGCFDGDDFDEPLFEKQLETEPNVGIAAWMYWIRKLQALVLAHDHVGALVAAAKAERLLWMSPAIFERADYHFFAALALAELCATAPAEASAQNQEVLAAHNRQLQAWAEHCPENFASRAALIGAETARLAGRELDAERLYEQAIRSARKNALPHLEAIAYERAAAFHRARGFDEIAELCLRNARHCYLRWGAHGKARQLEEINPHLGADEKSPGPTSTIAASVEHLDLATVIRLSQAVSGEIVLENLIDALMRLAIAQAGAERGLLVLPRGAAQRIVAEATTRGNTALVNLLEEEVSETALPISVLQYVLRTREIVILENAAVQSPFAADPYIRLVQARSVLCLPLLNQSRLVGALYLENNLAPHVFAPSRVSVLKLLASQAAISLENTSLYRDLADREARIRRLFDANIIGIFIWDYEGRIVEANDAFLSALGFDREDLVAGRLKWTDLTPSEWLDRIPPYKGTSALQPFEKEFFRKDGTRAPVLIGLAGFDDRSEQGVAFVLDLTKRKKAQAEARENERRYQESQMQLEHANRVTTMGQLTASIAHEVNQPIGAVVVNAQAALRWLNRPEPDLEEVRRSLERIVRDGVRAGEVVQRIRGLSKKTTPRDDLVNISSAVREVIELAGGEAAKHQVVVRTNLSEGLPLVRGDRVELQQVILNLILNAIEAMSGTSEAPRDLLISTGKSEPEEVLVSVEDSGPGLPTAAKDNLFRAFYSTKPKGLGLGLSICKSIVEAHGGRLWAGANEPRGSIFQFALPTGLADDLARG